MVFRATLLTDKQAEPITPHQLAHCELHNGPQQGVDGHALLLHVPEGCLHHPDLTYVQVLNVEVCVVYKLEPLTLHL